jgi:hypothetical protein
MPIRSPGKQSSHASDPVQNMADRPVFIPALGTQATDDSLGLWLVNTHRGAKNDNREVDDPTSPVPG